MISFYLCVLFNFVFFMFISILFYEFEKLKSKNSEKRAFRILKSDKS